MVCCRLSAVGCRCSNMCTKTCITCLMLEKSRKNPKKEQKKRKKCRRTQITLFINQQMLLHTVRREVTHFFSFKIHVRKNAVRTFFRAFFCTQESFWTFFFRIFFQWIFLWYFSLHMPNISHERFFRLRRAFHTTAVELFSEFYWTRHWISSHFKGLSLVNSKKKTNLYSNRSIGALFPSNVVFSHERRKKNSMIYSNCADVSIANLYNVDFSLINAENHKHISKVRNIHLYFSHGNHPCIHHGQYTHKMYWKRNSPRKKNQLFGILDEH